MLMHYRLYIEKNGFRSSEFISSLNFSSSTTAFVASLLETQMFHCFVSERIENPDDPEVRLFDDLINAKHNRSKRNQLTLAGRKETLFLDDTRSLVSLFEI
jgi:dDENN domain